MKSSLLAGVAALATLAAAPALADRPAHAGGGHGNGHARGHNECIDFGGGGCSRRGNPGHGWNDERHGGRHIERHNHDGGDTRITIHIGSDGRHGERWAWREGYGFGPAPYGREYRVINGQLVMVDSQTLQIVAIVGLLSALIN